MDTGGNPDFIMFEPGRKEIYTMNGAGKSATVFDVDGKVAATIPLGGKPEAGASDPAAGRVYVNNESGNSIVVIDTAKHEVAIDPATLGATIMHEHIFIDFRGRRTSRKSDRASIETLPRRPMLVSICSG